MSHEDAIINSTNAFFLITAIMNVSSDTYEYNLTQTINQSMSSIDSITQAVNQSMSSQEVLLTESIDQTLIGSTVLNVTTTQSIDQVLKVESYEAGYSEGVYYISLRLIIMLVGYFTGIVFIAMGVAKLGLRI